MMMMMIIIVIIYDCYSHDSDHENDDYEPRYGIRLPILRQLHVSNASEAEAVVSILSNCRCCSKVS